MLEGVLANVETDCSMETFYMLAGVFANMLRLSARGDLLHVGGSVS